MSVNCRIFSLTTMFLILAIGGSFYDVAAGTHINSARRVAQPEEAEHFEKLYPFDLNGKIDVSNINGSITVESWDGPQIKLEYSKFADSKERLADVEVIIDARQDSFHVETEYKNRPKNSWGNLRVDMRLTVPRSAILSKVSSVNGDLSISGLSNSTNASAVNGDIVASDLSGTIRISTVNGTVKVQINQFAGGNEIRIRTVNGAVTLFLPGDADAILSGKTLNGNISNDFGLTVTRKKYGSGSSLNGVLGGGNSKIDVSSVNGEIDIKRGGIRNL